MLRPFLNVLMSRAIIKYDDHVQNVNQYIKKELCELSCSVPQNVCTLSLLLIIMYTKT